MEKLLIKGIQSVLFLIKLIITAIKNILEQIFIVSSN